MFPLMIPMLIGAAGGALMNKKDPLKGALMGTALGAGGGLLAPAALGAAGVGGAAGAGTQAGMLAAQEAGLGATSLGWGGATTGVQGALNGAMGAEAGAATGGLLGQGLEVAKPVGQAMQTASMLKPQDQPPPMPPILQPPQGGAQGLAQLAGQNQQMAMAQPQMDMARKQKRYDLLNRFG